MLIDTIEKLTEVIPSLLACSNPVVDTETDGLNSFGTVKNDPNRIIGISVDDGREAYYFPFRHLQGVNLPMSAMGFFRGYLSDPHRTYGGFNYKFDQHMLRGDGIEYAPRYEDAMLGVHLLNENEPNFKLKDTCDRYGIGEGSLQETILLEKVHGKKDRMCELDPADIEPYACDDVRLTRGLLDLIKPALQHYGLFDIWQQINYYSYITALMENRGLMIDEPLINQYLDESISHKAHAFDRLHEAAGYPLNPNSSKQVCTFLDIKSSAAEELEILMQSQHSSAEFARLVVEARGWSSVGSRYYTPYLNLMDRERVLHCDLNLIGTISGRLSCSNPNLQAVARKTEVFKVKNVFISRPGYTLVSADYSQAEMRIACFYANEQTMAELIRNGEDLHSATATALGIPRDAAKRINFGVIYGIGAEALHDQLRVDKKVAQGYLNKYHGMYPQFRKLLRACEARAESEGVINMWTGRKRHFNVTQAYSHKAMSNLIQGGVAEMMRVAISNLFPAISDMGGYMLLQVHDQVIFEIPDHLVDTACKTIKLIMENFTFDPRMTVDISYGKSWGTLDDWDPTVAHGGYYAWPMVRRTALSANWVPTPKEDTKEAQEENSGVTSE